MIGNYIEEYQHSAVITMFHIINKSFDNLNRCVTGCDSRLTSLDIAFSRLLALHCPLLLLCAKYACSCAPVWYLLAVCRVLCDNYVGKPLACEAASAIEAAALYIIIMVVKYVGQAVAVPAPWEKATCATIPIV